MVLLRQHWGAVLLLVATWCNGTSSLKPSISKSSAKQFYDLVGPALDLLAPFEDAPRSRALKLAEVGAGPGLIVEVGCGTGRTAEAVLSRGHPDATYLGLEMSPRMAGLAEGKLAKFGDRAEVRNVDACAPFTPPVAVPSGDSAKVVVLFYVLDLLSEDDASKVLANCAALCGPDSRLCAVSITEGLPTSGVGGWLSRAVMGSWSRVASVAPVLLGGCRPQALGALLEREGWTVLETEAVAVAGYTSQICVCALKPREAQ